jgi:hypothetical protein
LTSIPGLPKFLSITKYGGFFMKRIVLAGFLGLLLAVGAFADHPGGWGIGAGFSYGGPWKDTSVRASNLTLFLKAPSLPIFWGITADIFDWEFGNPTYLSFKVTGDYYLFDRTLVPGIGLGWFLGVGGYLNYGHSGFGNYSCNAFDFGARLPIGLSFRPIDVLEIFIDAAPSIGFYYWSFSGSWTGSNDNGLGGGWQGDIGIRLWF